MTLLGGGLNSGSHILYHDIISLENLLHGWREFRRGKRHKLDVAHFEFSLEDNLFALHYALKNKNYSSQPYQQFYVADPKLRSIHKATVRDRVLHQALFRILYLIFDQHFIFDSYSCRHHKGTHRAVIRLEKFIRAESQNYRKTAWILQCDIKKFFDSVDQTILLDLIAEEIKDEDTLRLIQIIIHSFETKDDCGLPLGNVTSQLFANIYLNTLDQFVKHNLKIKHYIRYCDDIAIVSHDRDKLMSLIQPLSNFLLTKLKLKLHPHKIVIRKMRQGVDYLGYVLLPHYRVLRTRTKHRILRRVKGKGLKEQAWHSYAGMLQHCYGFQILSELSLSRRQP